MDTNFDLYNEILAAGPSPGTLFLILSKMKEEGGYKRVIQECIKALMIYPSDVSLRKLLAETYLADGQASMAENEFLKVSGYIRDLVSVYKSQAQIYLKQKRDEDAKESLKLYLAYCPDDEEAFDLLSSLSAFDDKQKPEGIRIDKTGEIIPEYPEENVSSKADDRLPEITTPTLAEIYFKQGQLWDAKEIYEKIVKEHPDDEKSLRRLKELRTLLAAGSIEEQSPTDAPADRKPEEPATRESVRFSSEAEARFEQAEPGDPARMKTEKMISVLENWLGVLQDNSRSSA